MKAITTAVAPSPCLTRGCPRHPHLRNRNGQGETKKGTAGALRGAEGGQACRGNCRIFPRFVVRFSRRVAHVCVAPSSHLLYFRSRVSAALSAASCCAPELPFRHTGDTDRSKISTTCSEFCTLVLYSSIDELAGYVCDSYGSTRQRSSLGRLYCYGSLS